MTLQNAAVQLLNTRHHLTSRRIDAICQRWEIVQTSGGYVLREDAVWDEIAEEYIALEDATRCVVCDCTTNIEHTRRVRHEGRRSSFWCAPCADQSASHCCGCDDLFEGDALFEGGNGEHYCSECLPEPEPETDYEQEQDDLPSYHRGWRPTMDRGQMTQPCYSVELEVESANRHKLCSELTALRTGPAKNWLGWERDGSLGEHTGVELLISLRPSLADLRECISSVLPALRRSGCTSWDNGRCGLHVNSNTQHWSSLRKARLLYLVLRLRAELERISGRAGAHWCAWPVAGNHRTWRKGMEQSDLLKRWREGALGKYTCVRAGSDRMEWRMFRGTLNARRIGLYLATVEAFEEASMRPVNVEHARLAIRQLCTSYGFSNLL